MKEESGKRKRLMITSFFVLLTTAALLAGTVTAVPGAEVREVKRYAPAGPAPSAEFEVKLTINGELPLVVGIVETIPEGFGFVSTTHPSGQYEVSGQKVAFAVIDETEISYRVKAPSSGEGTFTGTWIDMLSEKEGSITDTPVIVGEGGSGAIREDTAPTTVASTTATPATASTPASEVPGFGTIFTALSLLIACLSVIMMRNEEGGGGVE